MTQPRCLAAEISVECRFEKGRWSKNVSLFNAVDGLLIEHFSGGCTFFCQANYFVALGEGTKKAFTVSIFLCLTAA